MLEMFDHIAKRRDPAGKSGFFDLAPATHCQHREHAPPTHIHIPAGKGYRHVCPGCGVSVDLFPRIVTMQVLSTQK